MRYEAAPSVAIQRDGLPYFTTPHGGVIVTDDALAALWADAQGRTIEEIEESVSRVAAEGELQGVVRESLFCLVRAGVLAPHHETHIVATPATPHGPAVTAIVVVSSARELDYLDDCVQSIAASRYQPLHLVVVDNASGAPVEPRVRAQMPDARIVRLHPQRCLAAACNAALAESDAPYSLLMNPDVKLEHDCIARLVARALTSAKIAAVVPKTLLWRTPAFLNAIGNRVPAKNWGTDNGIGQLDLGQFDGWKEVPSASLTIELVSRAAWIGVGPFDETYPAYYEDADWSYRARLAGWTIAAEPAAQAWHIFGGFWDAPPDGSLSARKLTTAIIGRLQFASKIAGWRALARMVPSYLREDATNIWVYGKRRDWQSVRAYVTAWRRVIGAAPRLLAARRRVQKTRAIDDRALFPSEAGMPISCTHRNAPLLTAPLIRDYYAPFIRTADVRPPPANA